jgi:hypothetical protein
MFAHLCSDFTVKHKILDKKHPAYHTVVPNLRPPFSMEMIVGNPVFTSHLANFDLETGLTSLANQAQPL